MDEGHSVDVIYCDFCKGFDVVPHRRLLEKYQGQGAGLGRGVAHWQEAESGTVVSAVIGGM